MTAFPVPSSVKRLCFKTARSVELLIAAQACIHAGLTHCFASPWADVVSMIGLALTALLTSCAKKMHERRHHQHDTAFLWGWAGACLLLLAFNIPFLNLPPQALATAWFLCVVLLVEERRSRLAGAYKRVRRRRKEHRQWQHERQQYNTQWQERLRWLAGIQHDMRQPLQALGLLALHPSMQSDDKLSRLSRQLHHCQQWLFDLADNTLEAARMQMGCEVSERVETVSAHALIDSVVAWVAPIASDKALALEAIHQDMALRLDARRLKRVLVNLLHNAIRHTDHGRVWIYVGLDLKQPFIEVGDTGPGLPSDVYAQVTGAASTPAATGGQKSVPQCLPKRGLGLYVARQFCLDSGWRLRVVRSTPEGTVFRVYLNASSHLDVGLHPPTSQDDDRSKRARA